MSERRRAPESQWRCASAAGLVVLILVACSSVTPPSAPGRTPADGNPGGATAFSEADVQRAVEDLATLGIETRVQPGDAAPIAPVSGDRSLVRLLRFQVRNLALEQFARSGTRGVDLDALSTAGGGGPVSPLLAGWAGSGRTPAARWTASLLGQELPADPAAATYPTLSLVAFVADATRGSSPAAQRSAGPADAMLAAARTEVGAHARVALARGSDYCGEVSTYLSAALGEVVDSTADPPAWLQGLIDVYAPQYANDPGLLRKTIGAIALMVYATSLARPWTVSLVPDPGAVAYGIEGQDAVEGQVDLTVLSGADVFADDVADCASLADAQLASVPVEGSAVTWDASGLAGHATEATATSTVDDTGTAGLTYVMTTESQDDAGNGDPVSTQMSVNAWVDRAEMAALGVIVKSILLGEAAGSPAGSTAKALYQAMEQTLNRMLHPSGFTLIDVTYHTHKATPRPSQEESGITGNWVGTWVIDGYGNTGAFTMALTRTGNSFSGSVVITNTDCSNGPVSGTVEGTNITFDWIITPQPVHLSGTVSGGSMAGTWAAIACSNPDIALTGTFEATRE
jgi:hypothetical protein